MLIFDFKEYVYSKTVPWFSPMHKDWGNKLCIIYPFIYESVLITFTVRVTKQHSVNISFLKNNSAAHYRGTIGFDVLESK